SWDGRRLRSWRLLQSVCSLLPDNNKKTNSRKNRPNHVRHPNFTTEVKVSLPRVQEFLGRSFGCGQFVEPSGGAKLGELPQPATSWRYTLRAAVRRVEEAKVQGSRALGSKNHVLPSMRPGVCISTFTRCLAGS